MNETEIIERVVQNEARSKSNTKRIDELQHKQEEISDMVIAVKKLADREERLESDVKEIKSDVKELKEVPAARWQAVVEKIILVIVGAVIAAVLARVGL